jgi:2,4-dienoyl-CoA reductase-like NADH-dependent reductase (Old Yellow Enzyme family)
MVKESVKVPVITVGGIRSFGVADSILAGGDADYGALSRPLVREPHLINRWKNGDTRKATCISCCKCYNAAMEGKGIYWVEERRFQEKQTAALTRGALTLQRAAS